MGAAAPIQRTRGRWPVRLGGAVVCPDGRAGTVRAVALSPGARLVTGLVVRPSGRSGRRCCGARAASAARARPGRSSSPAYCR